MHRTGLNVDCDPEAALDLRIGGNLPNSVLGEPTDEDEVWDPIDLERRAEESAAMDAYERGLIFA